MTNLKSSFSIKSILRSEFYLLIFLGLFLLLMAVAAPSFFEVNQIMNVLNRYSYILIGALGMNLIILTGNIDVSAGGIVSVVCFVIAVVGKIGAPLPVLMLVAVVVGALLSAINAWFITKLKIPSIVTTLATYQLFAGILPLLVEGSIYDLPPSFTWLSFEGKVFGSLPLSLVFALVVAIIMLVYMYYSRFSKKIYAIGNNTRGAEYAGISYNKTIVAVYIIAGCLFGLAGVIVGTASQRVTTTMGTGLDMIFISAVVLGGTSTAGGKGTIFGTVVGALILAMIEPAINLLGIGADWSEFIMGLIILVSVVFSTYKFFKKKYKPNTELQGVK